MTEQPTTVERLARALFATHPLMYPESWPDDDPDEVGPDPREDAANIAREYAALAATPPERPVAPEWLSQALNEGDGTYRP